MKTIITLNGKKITRKKAEELFGAQRLKEYIEEATEGFREDPLEEQSWYTCHGMLTVSFA